MRFENFNDIEALKIAVNIEVEGREFYSILMENARSPETKEIFSKLASDEKDHLARFQKALLEVTDAASMARGCEDYTVDLYLKHLVDTGVFTQQGEAKRIASEVKTDIDALKIGIQAEKDSILYYNEAAKNTKYAAGRLVFEQLAHEEKNHLKLLAEQLKALKHTK